MFNYLILTLLISVSTQLVASEEEINFSISKIIPTTVNPTRFKEIEPFKDTKESFNNFNMKCKETVEFYEKSISSYQPYQVLTSNQNDNNQVTKQEN